MKKEKRVLTLHEKELKREKRIGIIITPSIIDLVLPVFLD